MKFLDYIEDLPPRHKDPATQKGNVDKVYYTTKGTTDTEYEKYCFVYTPFGYDPNKAYDVIYLLHGAEDVCDNCFYKGGFKDVGGEPTWKKYMMDNMIQQKESKPFIVAAVEWYPIAGQFSKDRVQTMASIRNFPYELTKDIMPVVEAKYHTYSNFNVDEESLKASRDHRAILGWSMGSVTTWEVAMKTMDYFRFYNNESCAVRTTDTEMTPEENYRLFVEKIKETGYTAKDFVFYMTTGTEDFAYASMKEQAEIMKQYPDLFIFEGEDANSAYVTLEGANHHTWFRRLYQYNAIKHFFPYEKQ